MSDIICKHCGGGRFVKNGFTFGKQRYKCKGCYKSFTKGDKRERYDDIKRMRVIEMYLEGIGIRSIERLEEVSNVLIIKWIRRFSKLIKDRLKKASDSIGDIKQDVPVLEIDEMVTWIKKNQKKIKRQESLSKESISSYGLLLIGEEIRLLSLK